MNKTRRFLYPCLKGYGDLFILKFNKTWKLAVGIHDYNIFDTFSYEKNKIYILFDSKYHPRDFESFMKWVRLESYYIYDYNFSSDFKYTRKHMLILKIPKEYEKSYMFFLEGKYSQMYSEKERDFLFLDKESEDYNILCNNSLSKKEMSLKIQKEFEIEDDEISFITNDFKESELPLKKEEEIFNFSGEGIFLEKNNIIF